MALSLSEALSVASAHTDPKNTDMGYHVVVLRDGLVRATNGSTGCEVACSDIGSIGLAVDCAALAKMVKAVGAAAKVKAIKGRQLQIEGDGVRYKLKAVPAASEPKFPEIPNAGWSEVTQSQMGALAAVASLVDPKNPNQMLAAVRLTPQWCAGGASDAVAFAWIEGLVSERFSVPPGIFDGLGEGQLVIKEGKLFLRDARTEQVRWSLGLALDWPDDSLSSAVVGARGGSRTSVKVDLADLGLLCRQAGVVAVDRAEGFRLSLSTDGVKLEGAQGVADFSGAIEASEYSPGARDEWVGVRPDRIALTAAVVGVGNGEAHMSIGGPLVPILTWGGGPVIIEALNMPVRLPEG